MSKEVKKPSLLCEKWDCRNLQSQVNEAALLQTSIPYMVQQFCRDNGCSVQHACQMMQDSVNRQDGYFDLSDVDPSNPIQNYQDLKNNFDKKKAEYQAAVKEAQQKAQQAKQQPAQPQNEKKENNEK